MSILYNRHSFVITNISIAVTVGQCLGDPAANWYKTTKRTKRDFEDDEEAEDEKTVDERSVSEYIERSRFRRHAHHA